ncbi:MAG: hypothetical protein M3Q30_12990 [Actinomycetota bacterium]|nr:hypothetical protein [Actinomycetota bacterium]
MGIRVGLILIGAGIGSYLWGWIGKEVVRQWDQLDPGAQPPTRSDRLALSRQQVVRRQAPVFRRLGLILVVIGVALVTIGVAR